MELINKKEKVPLTWRMHGHGVSTTAPASHGHSAVAYNNCLYIYGGDVKDNRRISEIHKHSLVTESWTKEEMKGTVPEPRSAQSSIAYHNNMYVFGGRDGRTYYADLYSYCFSTSYWTKLETRGSLVKRRYRHSAVVYNEKMYIFGGEFGGVSEVTCYNDFYEFSFDDNTWTEVEATGTPPEPRSGHTAVVYNGSMYVYAGRNEQPRYFNDLYQFNFATKRWSVVPAGGTLPPKTYNQSGFVYRDSLYIFGGYGSDEGEGPNVGHRHGDLYEYSFEQNKWSLVKTRGKAPSPRLGHTINLLNGSLYLYGGWDRNGYRSDLHSIHFDDIKMDLAGLLFNPKLAEVEFQVGDQKFPAHLSILFARCPKLLDFISQSHPSLDLPNYTKLFIPFNHSPIDYSPSHSSPHSSSNSSSNSSSLSFVDNILLKEEKKKIIVEIKNISAIIFSQILEYIYTDTLPFDPTTAVELRLAADQLGLDRCKLLSATQIKNYISPSNVLSLLQSADSLNENHVKNYCFNFIAKNYDDVANSDYIKHLKHELLVELLRVPTKDFLKANEVKDQSFILNCQSSPPTMKQDLTQLLGNPKFSDIQFIIEKEVIFAHHCILYARHPTFSQMWFESGMLESQTNTVEITNIRSEVFKKLLLYLYSGDCIVESAEEALDLITVADRYFVESLKHACEYYITKSLDYSNVLQALEVADNCRLGQLKDLCLDIISKNFSKIGKRKALKRLKRELLVEIIQFHARNCPSSSPSTPIQCSK